MIHEKKHRFNCKQCGYKCYQCNDLANHVNRVHLRIKPFKCDKCDYSAVLKRELKDHIYFNHNYAKKTGSLGEKRICALLDENTIPYQFDQTLDELRLYCNKNLRFDFIIEDADGAQCFVEFDGKQHFKPIEFFGGQEKYEEIQAHDAIKENFCKEMGYRILRVDATSDLNQILDFLMCL